MLNADFERLLALEVGSKPEIEDFPLRAKPRIEDYPILQNSEPRIANILVTQKELLPEDYPVWFQPSGWRKWVSLVLGATVISAVIVVVLLVGIVGEDTHPSVSEVFNTWVLFFVVVFFPLIFFHWLIKPKISNVAEKRARTRMYRKSVALWQEEADRLKAEQLLKYQYAMEKWQEKKEQRDREYQYALSAWEVRRKQKTKELEELREQERREYEKTKEAISQEMDHLMESTLVDEVSDWVINLFTEELKKIRPDRSMTNVMLECLIRVEETKILTMTYIITENKDVEFHLSESQKRKPEIYDFKVERRKNLNNGVSRVAMLMALLTKVEGAMMAMVPRWAGRVKTVYPPQKDLVAMSQQVYAEHVCWYVADNHLYEDPKDW